MTAARPDGFRLSLSTTYTAAAVASDRLITYRPDFIPHSLDTSFMLQFRTPQFHNRILCLTALYPRVNASKLQIYNTSTTNQRHFLHIVALNFATIFFRSSNMRDLPLTALSRTSALKTPRDNVPSG